MKSQISLGIFLCLSVQVHAEPYLAVQSSQPCSTCHTNPTGGGQRNAFGVNYGQTLMVATPSKQAGATMAALRNDVLALGANARYSARNENVDDRETDARFETDRVSLYLSARLNERVTFYVDQQVAPGGSQNREAWAKIDYGNWYLKAGKLFLPFGWRLEDDAAFIRQATGINFNSPDNGAEIGFQSQAWNIQLAVTNGTAGAGEVDDGKQSSLRLEHIAGAWRAGVSGNYNNTDLGDRKMVGVFAGLKTGKVSWLAEWDRIEDEGFGLPDSTLDVALLDANYALLRGHNLKITLEAFMSDLAGEEDRYRGSVVWEYFPWSLLQVRAGFRQFDSDNGLALDNRDESFVQLHVFF